MPAGAGEFTRRAFENGRLSLDQAEGVAAVVGARTREGLAQARRLLDGELGRGVVEVLGVLDGLRVEVEAVLGFPEDVVPGELEAWQERCASVVDRLQGWLSRFESGRRAREVPRVVLAGPPNAGKSALFNALCGRERALVHAQAGTTRDYVEASLDGSGARVCLVDTAGVRATVDPVEAAGVERSAAQLAGADLVVWVESAEAQDADRSPLARLDAPVIRVESKRDLGARRSGWTGVCAANGEGVHALAQELRRRLGERGAEGWIGLERHRQRVAACVERAREASVLLGEGAELEIAALVLGEAAGELAAVLGRSTLGPVGAEVLDRVFAGFCIGK